MAESFQNEVPAARVNIKLDLHTGGAQKKVELPLKLLILGDFSNGKDPRALAEKEKVSINKNNFDSVLGEYNPQATIAVENTLAGDGSEMAVNLDFKSIKDFHPEQVDTSRLLESDPLARLLVDDKALCTLKLDLLALLAQM